MKIIISYSPNHNIKKPKESGATRVALGCYASLVQRPEAVRGRKCIYRSTLTYYYYYYYKLTIIVFGLV